MGVKVGSICRCVHHFCRRGEEAATWGDEGVAEGHGGLTICDCVRLGGDDDGGVAQVTISLLQKGWSRAGN